MYWDLLLSFYDGLGGNFIKLHGSIVFGYLLISCNYYFPLGSGSSCSQTYINIFLLFIKKKNLVDSLRIIEKIENHTWGWFN